MSAAAAVECPTWCVRHTVWSDLDPEHRLTHHAASAVATAPLFALSVELELDEPMQRTTVILSVEGGPDLELPADPALLEALSAAVLSARELLGT